MTRLVDAEARHTIATRLDATVVVEAAAGTGKTTALVGRIVAVLAGGHAQVDQIVAVTFTEKAAGELKLRLRARLEEARRDATDDVSRGHLEHALAHLEDARVNTIHGFGADLLRERPVEARTDPRFEVLTEPASARLYDEAFSLWLQERLEDPPEGVRRSLRRGSGFRDEDRPSERLRSAGATLTSWRDLSAAWQRETFDRHGAIDVLVDAVQTCADLTDHCSNPRDGQYQDTAPVRRLRDDIHTAARVRTRDYDGLEAALVNLGFALRRVRSGYDSNWRDEVTRAEVRGSLERLVTALVDFRRAADADLAALLQQELGDTIDRYERLKVASGRLDFLDLLLRARDLLRQNAVVRADFQRRFTHIFVDEFQDTDPVQAEILLLLASDDASVTDWRQTTPVPGKLFIVGDPKQSIYRFRRADVGIYHEVRDLLLSRGALAVHLTTSFRSVPAIQRVVNAAFEPVMNADARTLQASYVPLSSHRKDVASQPAVVALPIPRPYGVRNVTMGAIEESLPDAVGAFVQWMVRDSGWTVSERDDLAARVPLAPRHVCVLFRRLESFYKGDMTRAYVAALEARDIPHLLVGGRSFHAREEVGTLRAALAGIEWPDSELSVFATLRGSLFGIGDEELLAYRARFGRLHPFRTPGDDVPAALVPVVAALRALRSLHMNRNRCPVAETINNLLRLTRAHAGFALRPSGEQALANVLHIADMARMYEAAGGISFRGFVTRLEEDRDHGRTSDAPILEEGSDGVRLMTVHKAKGLEFPVVILADITSKLAAAEASRHIDPERNLCAIRIAGWSPADLLQHEALELARDEAEGVRIAYVAATRARDLLVVPAVGDEPFAKGWVSPLNAVLYPPLDSRRAPAEAPGTPAFGRDSVLARPFDDVPSDSVQPGRHRTGAADFVWWDPATLPLGAVSPFGLRRQELLDKNVEDAVVESDVATHATWQAERTDALATGERPSLTVRTAREFAGEVARGVFPGAGSDLAEEAALVDVELVECAVDPDRPAGRRFGTLVHAVLATVPLDGSPDRVQRAAQQQARILGAPTEEVTAAATAVSRALGISVLARAQDADARGDLRRETPVAVTDSHGTVVDGVVDLAFREDDGWVVVDFKTDREISDRLADYEEQVRLYACAIARATGLPTSGILVRV